MILPAAYSVEVTDWDIIDCALSVASVNYILDFIDSKGWTGGTLSLEGGANGIPDSSTGGFDGLSAESSLTSKSWIVTRNS